MILLSRHILCFLVLFISSFEIRVKAICFEEECKQFVQPEVTETDSQEEEQAAEDDVQGRHLIPRQSLQQIHVIFRHGDRTPDGFYPNDPNRNFTFYPVGLKELTNDGKKREFQIGLELREAYNQLLGPYYLPNTIEARSSSYNRTKMSLQLVLASLYPPHGQQDWLKAYDWQPIPTYYLEAKNDNTFLQMMRCPSFTTSFAEVLQLPELQDELTQFTEWYEFLTQHTGMKVSNPFTMFEIYWTLRTEEEYGLNLPLWSEEIYPEPLTTLAKVFYKIFTYNLKLKKVTTGGLVTTIVENILSKKAGLNKYKIQLYSGHEINVAGLLRALEVFEPHVPNYGSHVILEVHKMYDQHFIKIVHQANEGDAPKILKMPKCAILCPLDEFINILEPLMIDWNNPCVV